MQVILKEEVQHLGSVGQVVNVKPGYARNYLLPKGFAVQASDRQLNRLAHDKKILENKAVKLLEAANKNADALSKITLTIAKSAGDQDKLFGSVTTIDIAEHLAKAGFSVDRRNIQLDEHIKSLGEFQVKLRLFKDVHATVTVKVVKEA
jgi:large subunit ribosomal protein L9